MFLECLKIRDELLQKRLQGLASGAVFADCIEGFKKLTQVNGGRHHRLADACYYIGETFANIEGSKTVVAADGTKHTIPLDYSKDALIYFQLSINADESSSLSAAARDKEKSNTLDFMAKILRNKHAYLQAEEHWLRSLKFNELNCNAYRNYAGMLIVGGKVREVIELLDRFLEASGNVWESAMKKLTQGETAWFSAVSFVTEVRPCWRCLPAERRLSCLTVCHMMPGFLSSLPPSLVSDPPSTIQEDEAWNSFSHLCCLRLFAMNYLSGTYFSPRQTYLVFFFFCVFY